MTSDLKLLVQTLCNLETTVSVYDHPELWIKQNSEQVKVAIGDISGLHSIDLNRILFPRIVAYIHLLSRTSEMPREITSLVVDDRWSSADHISRLSHYQSMQNALKNFLRNDDSYPRTFKENWDTIQYLDNLSVLAHTIVALKNHKDVRNFVQKGGSGVDTFLNLLQELLDAPYVGPARPFILRILLNLTKRCGVYPTSLILQDVVGNSSALMASGGFGHIYQGTLRNNVVAIKAMRIISTKDREKLVKSFIHEAILWRQFDHPNVVPFYGIHLWPDQQDQRICLVSPWMEHRNMVEYLISDRRANRLSLMLDVAKGIQYLHEFEPTVIHGDLKGNNILIKSDFRAAVTDFGLCTLIEDTDLTFTPTSTNVTGAGAWKYMAPELLRPLVGNPTRTTATDIYAFGCVCYEMFTGHPRFSDLGFYESMMAAVENRSIPQPEICSDELWVLIQTCWQVDPMLRSNISGIVRDLMATSTKPQRSESFDSRISPSSSSLLSSALYSQSIASLLAGSAAESQSVNLRGDEASPVDGICLSPGIGSTSEQSEIRPSPNPANSQLPGAGSGIIGRAGARLRTHEPTLLQGDQTKKLRNEDIIVAIIGPSGTGKSSFVNTVIGKIVAKVGDDLESCTQDVRAYGCIHPDGSGRHVVVVDTPGFDDTHRLDFDVLNGLAKWLAKTYRKKITLSGILYFHNIEGSRMLGSSIRNLQMFQALCGEGALHNVVLTTTYWDKVSPETGASRESQLQLKFWRPLVENGSRIARFQPRTFEAAWNLISMLDIPSSAPSDAPRARPALQIQTELVTEGKPLHQTAAYSFLLGWWTDLIDKLKRALGGKKSDRFKRAEKQKKKFEYRNTPGSPFSSGVFGQY